MLLLLWPFAAAAQSAATIPASSPVYDRIDAVQSFFPADAVLASERPLSRRQVESILARLAESIERSSSSSDRQRWARRELELIRESLSDIRSIRHSGRVATGALWRADIMRTNAKEERIASNGMGAIDALTHPFTPGRHGWPVTDGTMATVAPTGLLAFGSGLAMAAQATVSLSSRREQGWTTERFFHRLYGRATRYNVALQLGGEERRWGHSPEGALFLSGHTMPMPAVALGTDTAIVLPWLFGLIGPVRFTGMVAHQGPYLPEGALLAAWHATVQPWKRFEIGVAVTAQSGGEGAPTASLLDRIIDLFPLIDALDPRARDLQISNKLAGGSLRLRLPELSGADLYYELQFDDFDGRRLKSTVVDDAAQLIGARVPVLAGDQLFSWRGEYHRTSLRLYQHGQFLSGYTYRSRILGDPLGPHAAGVYNALSWQAAEHSIELKLAEEWRDPSPYTVTAIPPRDRGFRFIRLSDEPDHRRRRAVVTAERANRNGAVRVTIGYNRAWRTGQTGRDEWLALVSLNSRRLSLY